MNIRQVPGKLCDSQIRASPTSCPFRKSLFLAVGMLVPASDRRGLRPTEGTPELCPSLPARREAISAAVEAYNRAHPRRRCRVNAARLLTVMFGSDDICQLSLEALLDVVGVSRKPARTALSALLAAGVIAKEETGHGRHPNRYRLLLTLGDGA